MVGRTEGKDMMFDTVKITPALVLLKQEIPMSDYKKAQSIVGTNNDGGRPENDFYPTPPEGTLGLLKVEDFVGDIWEPACGDGAMSRVLEGAGYNVVSTDLEPRNYGVQADFLSSKILLAPNIVTNPPFRIALEFVEHARDLGASKVSLLCKLAFLEGQERATWLENSPLKNVWVFKKRLTLYREGMKMKNSGMIAFAWFVWERGYSGKPMIGWI
jgi:hypothetical protein